MCFLGTSQSANFLKIVFFFFFKNCVQIFLKLSVASNKAPYVFATFVAQKNTKQETSKNLAEQPQKWLKNTRKTKNMEFCVSETPKTGFLCFRSKNSRSTKKLDSAFLPCPETPTKLDFSCFCQDTSKHQKHPKR